MKKTGQMHDAERLVFTMAAMASQVNQLALVCLVKAICKQWRTKATCKLSYELLSCCYAIVSSDSELYFGFVSPFLKGYLFYYGVSDSCRCDWDE